MTAVAVLSILLSVPAFPQCTWTPRYSGQFRTTALDVSTAGDGYLWLASGYGVELFDVSTPGDPELVDSIAIPDVTRVVVAMPGGLAYAGSGSRVYVLQREGDALRIVRTVDAGGTVNDIVAAGALFAATAAGIAHFDILDPANPIRTAVMLPTSSLGVTSLAVGGLTLYATDGDSSVEQFSLSRPALPQGIGSLDSLPRASAVHVSPDGLVWISDQFGMNTDVFSGTTRLARLAFGTNSFAAGAGNVRYFAGIDRTLRAADFTSLDRVAKLLELPLGITAGTENAIHAMAAGNGTLYVAAGDLGLAVVDTTALARPYPMVSYAAGATTGVAAAAGRAWFSASTGYVTQYRIDAGGLALAAERVWDAGAGARVQDVSGTTLLTSNGTTATLWTLNPSTPAQISTTTFGGIIQTAVLRQSTIVALLADGSLWTASPNPVKVGLPPLSALARGGSAIAVAEPREDLTTLIRHYASGDFASTPATASVPGLTIGGLAADATHAALFTFEGLSVFDAASSSVRLVDGSTSTLPTQLAFSGDDLLLLSDNELLVYGGSQALTHRHRLPATAVAMAPNAPQAVVATTEGALAISYLSELPAASLPLRSAFYRGAASDEGRLVLSGPSSVDLYNTTFGAAPRFAGAIDAAGVVATAVAGGSAWTFSANGALARWSSAGVKIAEAVPGLESEGQPLGLSAAGGALWLSYSGGCQASGCARVTVVVDPASLNRTATLTGAAVDVAISGKRAYALFEMPAEVRIFDVSDPLHPSQLASTAAPATARSLAHSTGKVNVLGDRIYPFSDTTLAPAAAQLSAAAPTPGHRIRIDGNCAVVTGRGSRPELYDVRTWSPIALPAELPSPVRTMVLEPGRLLLLTEHSLELWTTAPVVPAPKRRAAR